MKADDRKWDPTWYPTTERKWRVSKMFQIIRIRSTRWKIVWVSISPNMGKLQQKPSKTWVNGEHVCEQYTRRMKLKQITTWKKHHSI